MSKSALVVSFAALALAGWTAYAQQQLGGDLAAREAEERDLAARLTAAERALATLRPISPPETFAGTPPPEGAVGLPGGGPGPDAASGPRLAAAPRPGASAEERLATLEREVAQVRAASRERAAAPPAPAVRWTSPKGWWPTVEAAAKELDLDPAQRAGLERAVDDTRRQLDDLHARPNEEGLSYKELEKGLHTVGREGGDMETAMAEHMAKMARWRRSKVPGSNETYAEAQRRLQKEGKERARSYLNPEQAKTWDKSHPDALFAGGGGAAVATSFVLVGDGATLEVSAPPLPAPPPPPPGAEER